MEASVKSSKSDSNDDSDHTMKKPKPIMLPCNNITTNERGFHNWTACHSSRVEMDVNYHQRQQQHNSIARIIIQREKSCKCTEYEPTSVFGTHNQLQAKLQHKSS